MDFIKELRMYWRLLEKDAVSTPTSATLRGAAPKIDADILDKVRKEVKALTPEDVLVAAVRGAQA